jgi:hypothetical protein
MLSNALSARAPDNIGQTNPDVIFGTVVMAIPCSGRFGPDLIPDDSGTGSGGRRNWEEDFR